MRPAATTPAPSTRIPATTAPGTAPRTETAASAPSTVAPTTPATKVVLNAPSASWGTVDAAAAGFDPAALERFAVDAERAGATCTAIVRDGRLVDERTYGAVPVDEPRHVWSITKSVTSVLVGIAADQGLLSVDDRVSKYVPEWIGTPSEAVTVRNLLSNDSGRHWDSNTDYVQMAASAEDKTAFAVALGQDAPPGTVWAYNNSAIQVLSRVLEVATGESPVTFAERVLFQPIGMTRSQMTTDDAGNAMTWAGLQTTCSDIARFGWLIEQHGLWNGTQIVSAQYVIDATAAPSTELNAAYGWLWWLNHQGPIGSADVATSGPGDGSIADGQMVPGRPESILWAIGLFSQLLAVIPDQDIVAVRLGDRPDGTSYGVAELTGGVLDALVS